MNLHLFVKSRYRHATFVGSCMQLLRGMLGELGSPALTLWARKKVMDAQLPEVNSLPLLPYADNDLPYFIPVSKEL